MNRIGNFLLAALLAGILLTGCGAQPQPAESVPPAPSASEATAPAESVPAEDTESAPEEEPRPIHADQLREGTYPIGVSSSSSMFRIIDARLTVENGEMSALLTLGGTGYEKLYMGTGEEALADTDDRCVYFMQNADGKYTYRVPVAALDEETACAAWSIRKETWYDRTLVFESARLPAEAFKPAGTALPADGQYLVGVTLSGGSGRASVESPAVLTVADGAATAAVVWSSPFFEWMRVDGATYDTVDTDGNAAFEIPAQLDADMAVTARTIAMSEPHEIGYTLRFDSSTIRPLETP